MEIQFTANEDTVKYRGAGGNDISIVVQREDLGTASAEPEFEIDPLDLDRLIIKLNTNSDNPLGVDDLLQALADPSSIALPMVSASLIGPDSTPIGTGGTRSYGLTFSETFDFGTQGLVVMEFTTIDLDVAGGVTKSSSAKRMWRMMAVWTSPSRAPESWSL